MSQQLSGRSEQNVPERFVPAEMQGELVELEHLARYQWAANYAAGKRVLDAGCGVGYGTALLAKAEALEVVGVDVAEPVVTAAGTEHQFANAKFAVGDVTSLDFPDDSFDLVVCFEVIEHVEEQEKVFDELTRLLAPEGLLLISSPNPESYPSGNPHHIRELRPAELKDELTKRFRSVQTLAQENWLVSALFDEQTLQIDDGDEIKGGVRATKHQPRDPEFRTYTVGVASNATLPQLEPFGAFGPPTEVKRWLEIYREQDQILQEQRNEIAKQGIYYGDRGELREALITAEMQLAKVPDLEAQLLDTRRQYEQLFAEFQHMRTDRDRWFDEARKPPPTAKRRIKRFAGRLFGRNKQSETA